MIRPNKMLGEFYKIPVSALTWETGQDQST